jgi:AraC-like DNA-binding protein
MVAAVHADVVVAQVRAYVGAHVRDPGLDAHRIAAAQAVSVRQLYRLCAAAGLRLEQEIIDQRLTGARAELAEPASRHRPIAVVARGWGFADASHFTRRFREAFDTTPREWRRATG